MRKQTDRFFHLLQSLIATSILFFTITGVHAQEASENEAFGLDVGLSASVLGIGLVNLDVGPAPHTQAAGSSPYTASDQVLGLEAGTILNLLTASAGVLSTDLAFDGHGGFSTSVGQVEGLGVGVSILNLLGLTLGADSVTGVASIEGYCGNLSAEGDTELVGAALSISGAGIIDLPINPPPNTVVDVLGILGVVGVELILNEQIVTGNGVTHLNMLTNAIRLSIDISVPLVGSVGGSVIVSQAEATRNCNTADLVIDKTANPDPATTGETLTYTLTAFNSGPETARDVLVIDNLPASAEFISASASQGDCSYDGTDVTCAAGDLAAGASVVITILVTPLQAGELENTASAVTIDYDPNPDGDIITIITVVEDPDTGPGEANLSLTKTATPNPGQVGQPLTFNFSLHNGGPDNATNVILTDQVPAGFQITGTSASSGGNCNVSSQTVTCGWPQIAGGNTVGATIETLPQLAGTFTNNAAATADQDDPDPDSAGDSIEITIEKEEEVPQDADLALQASATPVPATVGLALNYHYTVINTGPADAVNVVLTDILPGGVLIQNVAFGNGGQCHTNGGAVSCAWPQLGAFEQFNVSAVVIPLQAGALANTAVVGADSPDPDLGNNTAGLSVTVQAADTSADLSMSKSVSPSEIQINESATFTLEIGNAGPDTAEQVVVTDNLPSGLLVESVSATGGAACQHGVSNVQCVWGSLAAGAQESVAIVATATAAGTYTNSAAVSSNISDPDPDNSNDVVTLVVHPSGDERPQADLVTRKRAVPGQAAVGQPILFSFEITNNGPDAATNVQLRDMLPSVISILSVSANAGGNCINFGNRIECNWDELAAGQTANAVLTVTSDVPGTYTNAAVVFSPDSDDPCPSCAQDQTGFEFTEEEALAACELHQASRNTTQVQPRHALNAGGNTLLFTSNENPTGDNPARHRALYAWDVLEKSRGDRLARPDSALELLAASRDNLRILVRSNRHPVTRETVGSQLFRLDNFADKVDSLPDIDPFATGVAAGNYGRVTAAIEGGNVLLADLENGLREFTLSGIDTATIADVRLSGNDRFLVFSASPAGETPVREVFLFNTENGDLEQLTAGGGNSRPAAISSTGHRILILSDTALAADAGGNSGRAYLLDADGTIRRIGPADAEVSGAGITHNGNHAMLLHAGNADGSAVVSRVDLNSRNGSTEVYEFPEGSAGHIDLVSLNQSGTVLSFNSSLDLLEENLGEFPQAYVLDCFEPRHGLWGNRARSGHGMELNLNSRGVLFNFWFTYTPAGDPTWYMIIGDLVGRSWEATMYSATLGTDGAETQEVGTMWAGFDNNEAGLFSWELKGEPGFEPLEYREFVPGPPEIDFSGSFYAPDDSGWGFSHISLREVRVATLYYYDDDGNPVWAQGVAGEDGSYELMRLHGSNLCPGCTGQTSTSVQPSGIMFVDFADQNSGQVLLEAGAADGSSFARDDTIKALARPAP